MCAASATSMLCVPHQQRVCFLCRISNEHALCAASEQAFCNDSFVTLCFAGRFSASKSSILLVSNCVKCCHAGDGCRHAVYAGLMRDATSAGSSGLKSSPSTLRKLMKNDKSRRRSAKAALSWRSLRRAATSTTPAYTPRAVGSMCNPSLAPALAATRGTSLTMVHCLKP